MNIRRANKQDINGINRLLFQVLDVHHKGRPDLFKEKAKKYTDRELEMILADDSRPVFVAVDEKDQVVGYAFTIFQQHIGNNILTDVKTLYVDDLCVDQHLRGQHLGRQLYEYVKDYAKDSGCYNLTLNVWACNKDAIKFYETCGLQVQKMGLENIL